MKKVIIAGGRDFRDYDYLKECCNKIIEDQIVHIVSGKAPGADSLGEQYAKERDFEVIPYPAKWGDLSHPDAVIKEGKYGKYDARAGHRRNGQMAEVSDVLIAFWNGDIIGSGTWDMVNKALRQKLEIHVFRYEKKKV